MNTGMKAPEGMGMVVETADIQNCDTKSRIGGGAKSEPRRFLFFFPPPLTIRVHTHSAHLHDEEEQEDDEDVDLRVKPHGRAAQAGRRGGG